jgi:alkylation response protein AidB-like acyl-CoA dehydrogenase
MEDLRPAEERHVRKLITDLLDRFPPETTPVEEFLQARYDAGLAWTWFPVGFGGLEYSPTLQTVADHEFAAAGAPNTRAGSVGYMMTASAIVSHASDELKRRFLPVIFKSDGGWCQLFSEPGAGSDLAGLSTRAVRDGDEWVVDGQKVWSSQAMWASWGLLLARTNPDIPKHNGMTMFMLDMHARGVEVRPLRNIVGTAEFAETFFTGARVPDADRIGEVGDGWRVALTTLMNERVNFTADFAGAGAPRTEGPMQHLTDIYRERHAGTARYRDEFMRAWVASEVGRLTNARAAQRARTGIPGPEGSIGKVASTELTKTIANLAVKLLGPDGAVLPCSYPQPSGRRGDDAALDDIRFNFLASPSNTIMGGTSEIQRNNIAERVLGLPGEPRADKGVPWKDIPRSA